MSSVEKFIRKINSLMKNVDKCELDTTYIDLFSLNLIKTHAQYNNSDGNILFFQKEKDIPDKMHNQLIFELLESNSMLDLSIASKDIKTFFNFLIKQVTNKLVTIVEKFEKEDVLINLYLLSSYIIQFHQRIRLILHSNLKTDKLMDLNPLELGILTALEINNENKDLMVQDIDGILGIDKAIIQYLFAVVMKTKPLESHHYKFNKDTFLSMYYLCYSAITLISQRELVMSKVFSNKYITVCNGMIKFEDDEWHNVINQFQANITEERIRNPYEELPQISSKLKENFKKNVGFNFDHLTMFLDFESYIAKDEKSLVYPFFKDYLVSLIEKITKCSKGEASKLIDYLTLKKIKNDELFFKTIDTFDYRLLEKPLLVVEVANQSLYLVSVPLLINSIQLSSAKLVYNLIPECSGDNSEIIKNHIKNETVLAASNIFKNFTKNVLPNAKDFFHQRKKFSFKCEYDILAVINNTLIVAECKDITYKFTAFGFKKDIGKTIDFINEITDEMAEIRENIEVLEDFFQIKIEKIIPLIVFKNHNMAINASFDKKEVGITSIILLREWIHRNFELI